MNDKPLATGGIVHGLDSPDAGLIPLTGCDFGAVMADLAERAKSKSPTTHTLTLGEGGPSFTVTNVEWSPNWLGDHTSPELPVGSLTKLEMGFKMRLSDEGASVLHEAVKDVTVDPDFDEHFDDWRCPGCGKTWDEIPIGHSWGLRFDPKRPQDGGIYSCSDPAAPPEPSQWYLKPTYPIELFDA